MVYIVRIVITFCFLILTRSFVSGKVCREEGNGIKITYSAEGNFLVVNSISELLEIQDSDVKNVLVNEQGRGGIFEYVDSREKLKVDHGIVFRSKDGGFWIRRFDGEIYLNWFIDANADNHTNQIQAAINATPENGTLFISHGTYKVNKPIQVKQRISIIGSSKFGPAIIGDFNGPVFTSSGQLWRNVFKNLTVSNNFDGDHSGCFSFTAYQVSIEDCSFSANHGFGIELLGKDYSVENYFAKNYFYGCKWGIRAFTNSHSNTDAFIIDNYFYGKGTQENGIYWSGVSGSTIRGNHFYGGASKNYLSLPGGGVNVSIIGNYFENCGNPRMHINTGNPGSYTIVGNTFWGGDGKNKDYKGDQCSLISIGFNANNRGLITLAGNVFEGGKNSIPIFNLLSGSFSASSQKISFDDSNILAGEYSLGVSGKSGKNQNKRIVVSNHEEFNFHSRDRSISPSDVFSSNVFYQGDSGYKVGNPVLPEATQWLTDRKIFIYNISENHEIRLSTTAKGGIKSNTNSDGTGIISPKTYAELFLMDGGYYLYIKDL